MEMMGQQARAQDQLFYSFNLDAHIPSDHLLRGIDRFLDLGGLRCHLGSFYSHTGRPSVDPELMIRMLIVGYCFGIRSERRLCEEVHLNLGYRWFCRLGLGDSVPDHSTFSKNRHGRFRHSDTLRFVFERVLARCIAEGLVGGEGFAIDASLIKADANRQRGVPGTEVDWSAVRSLTRPVRVSGSARRCRDREKYSEKHLLNRSRGAVERCGRTRVLCLLDQLPDRYRRGHRGRCGGNPSAQARRDQRDEDNDQPG